MRRFWRRRRTLNVLHPADPQVLASIAKAAVPASPATAELVALGQDLKNLLVKSVSVNSSGTVAIAMEGGGKKPEVRFSKAAAQVIAWAVAPPPPTPEPKPEPPAPPAIKSFVIGTNDPVGWGLANGKQIVAAGIKGARIEGPSQLVQTIEAGYTDILVIVGNTSDGSRLSTVNKTSQTAQVVKEAEECAGAIAAHSGVSIELEFMNEAYFKGASHNNEGAIYAALYSSAQAAIKAKGINIPLLANLDATLGWVEAMPVSFFATVDAWSIHPYGTPSWAYGLAGYLKALAYVEAHGGTGVHVVTEYGQEINGAEQGNSSFPGFSVALESERQTNTVQMAEGRYADPRCRGFYYYESHHESTTVKFGFYDRSNNALPLMGTLAGLAKQYA